MLHFANGEKCFTGNKQRSTTHHHGNKWTLTPYDPCTCTSLHLAGNGGRNQHGGDDLISDDLTSVRKYLGIECESTTGMMGKLLLCYTAVRAIRRAPKNVPIWVATAGTTSCPTVSSFLGGQLEVAPYKTCVPTNSPPVAYLHVVDHLFAHRGDVQRNSMLLLIMYRIKLEETYKKYIRGRGV